MKVDNKKYVVKLAWGGGGQYVILIEDLDLVIAITARARSVDEKTLELIKKRVLTVFALST